MLLMLLKGNSRKDLRSHLAELGCPALSLPYGLLVQRSEFPDPVSQLLSKWRVLLCEILD